MKINIKKILEEKQVSQTQLAKDLGKSQPTISRWAKGINQPLLSDVVKLTEYLGKTSINEYIIKS